jgi:hypothetical protein
VRVRIAYSVELDEVEKELSETSCNILAKIREASDKINDAFDLLVEQRNSYGRSLVLIDEARQTLAGADSTLSDLQAVIVALEKHYRGEQSDV